MDALRFKWEILKINGQQRVFVFQKSPASQVNDIFICEIGFPLFEKNDDYYNEKEQIAQHIIDTHNARIES